MPATRPALAKPKAMAGTRQGNGCLLLEGVDGRSWGARRFRELVADLAEHLGGGAITAPQEAIVRRAAQLMVWSEEREAAFARGEDFDVTTYATVANSLRRLLTDLGLERKVRDVTPDLRDYLATRAATAEDAA